MKRKKRKPTPHAPLSPEDESLVLTLLDECEDMEPDRLIDRVTSSEIALNLISRLPADRKETIPILQALGREFPEKDVRKAIKKALFRLQKKGLSVSPDLPDTTKGPVFKSAAKESPVAALSGIDGMGNRAVFLALPHLPTGFEVGMGIVNDETGMIQFQSGVYSKKRMKEINAVFTDRVGTMVEASLPHAAAVLEQAYVLELEGTGEAPEDYLAVRPRLMADLTLPERPAIRDMIPDEEVPSGVLTDRQLEALFGHFLFESWIVPPEEIQPLLESLDGVEDSPIVLSETQTLDRERDLKRDWLSEHYTEKRRALLKRRLEEMAYVLQGLGEADLARTSLAASGSLASASGLIVADPVPEFLLNRSLDIYRRAMKETPGENKEVQTAPSSILVP